VLIPVAAGAGYFLFSHILHDATAFAAVDAAHAGHASAGGKGHFRLRIVSTCFEGLKPLQRHRLVNETLAPLFETELHAVAMETLTPEEFDK